MSSYQLITLLLAFSVASCLVGIGIAISLKSVIGGIACALLATILMGVGFSYKKRHQG